jgi:hypothetical protein
MWMEEQNGYLAFQDEIRNILNFFGEKIKLQPNFKDKKYIIALFFIFYCLF